MSKGLVYFAQNPAFQHLTKIGWTTRMEVEDRGLSTSNVPEDYNYLAVFECERADFVEREVHEFFKQYRHITTTGRKTEFFWTGCIKDAIRFVKRTVGVKDVTNKEVDEEITTNEDGEKQVTRRPLGNERRRNNRQVSPLLDRYRDWCLCRYQRTTTNNYCHFVKAILERENLTFEELDENNNIHKLISKYERYGSEAEFGQKGHAAAKNSIIAYGEFLKESK